MFRQKTQSIFLSLAIFALSAPAAHAQVNVGLGYAAGTGLSNIDIRGIAVNLVRSFLGLLGFYLVVHIMWGGFLLMTHGGKDDKHAAAMKHVTDGVMGLFLMMISSSLIKYVVDAILNATGNGV